MERYFGLLILTKLILASQLVGAIPDGSCISGLGLGVIANGATVEGYLTPTSLPGMPCTISYVTCLDGVLNGPDLYPSCADITCANGTFSETPPSQVYRK